MLDNSLLALLPILATALTHLTFYYIKERAVSASSPAFLMGLGAVALAFLYLGFRVLRISMPYGAVVFGLIGVAALIHAIWRFTRM